MSAIKKAPSGNHARPGRPNPVSGCPLTAALAALRREMPSISQKVLTQQLRELVSDGIVRRQPKGAIPSPVEYSLTDYGRSVLPLVENVRLWGRGHIERVTSQTDEPNE